MNTHTKSYRTRKLCASVSCLYTCHYKKKTEASSRRPSSKIIRKLLLFYICTTKILIVRCRMLHSVCGKGCCLAGMMPYSACFVLWVLSYSLRFRISYRHRVSCMTVECLFPRELKTMGFVYFFCKGNGKNHYFQNYFSFFFSIKDNINIL